MRRKEEYISLNSDGITIHTTDYDVLYNGGIVVTSKTPEGALLLTSWKEGLNLMKFEVKNERKTSNKLGKRVCK